MALTSLQVALPHAGSTAWRSRRPPRRFLAAASGSGGGGPPPFQRLREQLLQLHAEADLTQSKANSARVRLVRLTEAAENLKKRAAASVRMGKENEAVDLLVQKKKLTRALESLKQRIEVLDKLSAKISEAISAKQNMLIEHALHPEALNGEDSNNQIRVFSGKVDEGADGASDSLPKSVGKDYSETKNVKVHGDMAEHFEQSELQMDGRLAFSKDHDQTKSIKIPSLYNAFLEHIDSQLKSLEYEIEQFISSQLVEGMGIQKQINTEQQILSDILKRVTKTRERIASILNKTVNGTGAEDLR